MSVTVSVFLFGASQASTVASALQSASREGLLEIVDPLKSALRICDDSSVASSYRALNVARIEVDEWLQKLDPEKYVSEDTLRTARQKLSTVVQEAEANWPMVARRFDMAYAKRAISKSAVRLEPEIVPFRSVQAGTYGEFLRKIEPAIDFILTTLGAKGNILDQERFPREVRIDLDNSVSITLQAVNHVNDYDAPDELYINIGGGRWRTRQKAIVQFIRPGGPLERLAAEADIKLSEGPGPRIWITGLHGDGLMSETLAVGPAPDQYHNTLDIRLLPERRSLYSEWLRVFLFEHSEMMGLPVRMEALSEKPKLQEPKQKGFLARLFSPE